MELNLLCYTKQNIFIDADWDQLSQLINLLRCFVAVSGLKINNAKTKLTQVGKIPQLEAWADHIGCGVELLPLGLPLGANIISRFIWDTLIEKFDQKLKN